MQHFPLYFIPVNQPWFLVFSHESRGRFQLRILKMLLDVHVTFDKEIITVSKLLDFETKGHKKAINLT